MASATPASRRWKRIRRSGAIERPCIAQSDSGNHAGCIAGRAARDIERIFPEDFFSASTSAAVTSSGFPAVSTTSRLSGWSALSSRSWAIGEDDRRHPAQPQRRFAGLGMSRTCRHGDQRHVQPDGSPTVQYDIGLPFGNGMVERPVTELQNNRLFCTLPISFTKWP